MAATVDRDAATLVTQTLGRTQALTPDGFLLCSDVPIARTGTMMYAPSELPILDAGGHNMLTVMRDAEALFDADAVASFSGKDITLSHPDVDGLLLNPKNWTAGECVGVCLNPRRGEGLDAEYLVADLLIKRADAIDAVRSGRLREVSCGYNCEYKQAGPGVGRQVRIVGNHVALVDRGRCGPSCAIGDEDMAAKPKKPTWGDAIKAAFYGRDETALTKALADAEADPALAEPDADDGKGINVHVHNYGAHGPADKPTDDEPEDRTEPEEKKDPLEVLGHGMSALADEMRKGFATFDERIGAIEGRFTKDEPKAEGEEDKPVEGAKEGDANEPDADDEKKATTDSASLAADWRETVSKAEVIYPGAKPTATFDAKAKPKATLDAICGFKRQVLSMAVANEKRAPAVKPVLGARTVDKLPCDFVAIVFDAAHEIAKGLNNAKANPKAVTTADLDGASKSPRTPAEQQAANLAWRDAQKAKRK